MWFQRGYVGVDGQEKITDYCETGSWHEAVEIFNSRNEHFQPHLTTFVTGRVNGPDFVRESEQPVNIGGEPMTA